MNKTTVRRLAAARRQTDNTLRNHRKILTTKFIHDTLSSIDTPVSLSIWMCYKYNEHRQIAERSINPHDYNCGGKFSRDLAAVSLLSKSKFLRTGIDTKAVALDSFQKGEEQCRLTNVRLGRHLGSTAFIPFAKLLSEARRKIGDLLGPFDPVEWLDSSRFGPGATTSLRRSEATLSTKYLAQGADITSALDSFLTPEMHSLAYPSWVVKRRIRDTNAVIVVDKNAKTGRTIAKEPDLNLWYQKGIGTMIRARLLKAGIDLNSQLTNQAVAQLASDGQMDYVTVDFKNASNTLSRVLVDELLPVDWRKVMDVCRSRSGCIDGGAPFTYEMFSSMGNGFTFELESLIFWALGKALTPSRVYVYGDDVCVPSAIYEEYRELCAFAGFTINTSKTFSTSYFRESCGGYYFNGKSVKPFFLKERIDRVEAIYQTANGLRRLAISCGESLLDSNIFRRPWLRLCLAVPESLRLFVPAGVGDCGFVHPRPNYRQGVRVRVRGKYHEGYTYIALRKRSITHYVDHIGLLFARMVDLPQISSRNEETSPSQTKWTFGLESVQYWYETEEEFSLHLFRTRKGQAVLGGYFANTALTPADTLG